MAIINVSNNADALKRWYHPGRVHELMYRKSPLLGILPKSTNFTGSAKGFAVIGDGPVGGRSAEFAQSIANESVGDEKQFLLTRIKDYNTISIDREAIKAADDEKGGFFKLGKKKIDHALGCLTDNMGFMLYNNGGGARAQVGSTSTTTLTLKDTRDIHNFAVGMVLDTSTTDGTSGSADGGGITVTAINRRTGTLTAAGNWTAASNFSDDDYIFVKGDFGAALSGLDAWVPATDPSATAFFGVDRSTDVVRYGGVRYDGSNETIEEAIISAESELQGVFGGDPAVCMMNPVDWRKLSIHLGARTTYDMMKPKNSAADFGYRTITLQGGRMDIQCVADFYCPSGVAYLLQPDTWDFCTLGPAPDIAEALGHKFQWNTGSDSIQVRLGWFGNLGCHAPGFNARITLPTS